MHFAKKCIFAHVQVSAKIRACALVNSMYVFYVSRTTCPEPVNYFGFDVH